MKRHARASIAALVLATALAGCDRGIPTASPGPPDQYARAINTAEFKAPAAGGMVRPAFDPAMVKLAVLLDRARYSPGAIDGHFSDNLRRALQAYRKANGLSGGPGPDRAAWNRLTMADPRPVVRAYVIDADDVAGPFIPGLPSQPEAQTPFEVLAYARATEELAETFHMDEQLLKALNPKSDFRAGSSVLVVDKGSDDLGADVVRLEIDRAAGTVRAYGAAGLLAAYPATVGSLYQKAPAGPLKVEAVAAQPAWDFQSRRPTLSGGPGRRSVEVAPGPNNPVGSVWIELSDHACGLHGSPDPSDVGKPGGQGCVRLTNWDARELARAVTPGAAVIFH